MRRWVKDLLIAVLIICGGIYLLLFIGSTSPRVQAPAQTPVYSSVPVGSEGQLRSGGSVIPVAIDEELLPELKRVIENNDPNGLETLSGPVFFVADATPVRVSESGAGGLRVSILAGTQKGRSGWVPFEWVKPSNP
jgi:hypothetical protein